MTIPELPENIGEYKSIGDFSGNCPDISGVYNRMPDIWEQMNENDLLKKIKGSNFEHISLFNLGDKKQEVFTLTEKANFNLDEIEVITANENEIQITTLHLKKNKVIVSSTLKNDEDYHCKDGFINFKLRVYKGGADGSTINFKSMTRISLLENLNVIIYKQIAYPDQVQHLYAIYKREKSDNKKRTPLNLF
jgi:hypothetical protein